MLALLAVALLAAADRPGAADFRDRCAGCHGMDGAGGERAPSARVRGRTDAQLRDLIRQGMPAAGMPGFDLPQPVLERLVAFLRGIREREPSAAGAAPARELPWTAIARPEAGSWPTYNGRLDGNRYSPLKQIHAGNVAALAPRWIFTVPGSQRLEVTPVVADGVMYVTAANECYALDAASGKLLWSYRRPRTKGVAGDAAGGINRGVALLGNRVFMITDNARLIALDRRSGALLWDVEMADWRENYGATAAPLVVKDLVVSGTSGGDEGVRGFVAAYKAETGERVWRFWTVPLPGEPAAATWIGKAIEHGCASTWLTGTYDPSADLIYWPTGNPCPDYNGDERRGDNLYSDSVVALRPPDGQLRWHYQFTPHDLHDWDAVQTPMLVDTVFRGRPRKLLLQANRNGFFYALDRTSGELLLAAPFIRKLNWASGIGPDGRPKLLPGTEPTPEGVEVCPSVDGATNWMSTAFDPARRLFYVMALEKCSIYTKSEALWRAGESFYGGGTKDSADGTKVVRALELDTGRIVWELPLEGRGRTWGGLLATAGGLIFFGDDSGEFTAADSGTGKRLWHFPANQNWRASPMTYTVGGRQFIAIAGGPNILVFGRN